MRTEDFTALVDALLPDDYGTAAFLYAKQATLVALGVRQLLFFLAETTPLRSRLAEEANATALVELLGNCGLAAKDDLRLVRTPPAPPTFRSLGSAPKPEASQLEDSEPQFRSLHATEQEGSYSSMGAAEENLVEVHRPPMDDEAALRQQAEALQAGSVEDLMTLLRELKELRQARHCMQQAQAELEQMREQIQAGVFSGTTARRVLCLIMCAAFKPKGKTKRDIFQPCAKDLELLQMARDDDGRSIIDNLHKGNLSNFHSKLWPTDPSSTADPSVEELNDSIFHHDTKESSTLPVYKDQQKRAASIASIVKKLVDDNIGRPVCVRLLDGHGRMLLSIINEVKKLSLNPEDHLRFQVFEIDEEVKEWHAAVFPERFVETRYLSITSPEADTVCDPADILYLNFCSVPTRLSKEKDGGNRPMNQLVRYLNEEPGASEPCNKESVLTFIAKRMQRMHVMISFFIATPGQNGQPKEGRVDNIPRGQPIGEMDAILPPALAPPASPPASPVRSAEQEVRGGLNCGGCQALFQPTLLPPTFCSLSHLLLCLPSVGDQSPEQRCQGPERARAAVLAARSWALPRHPRIQSP